MAEDIKNLIEKIYRDGVNLAEDKAKSIEEEAVLRAKKIIEEAQIQAKGIIFEAQRKAAKIEESGRIYLRQVSRDFLLSLRGEINAILDKLILRRVQEALSPQEISGVIAALVKDCSRMEKGEIFVSLNQEDLKPLQESFLKELAGEVAKGITLKPSEDISGGFIISYDRGKSHYDFTDKALAEYIGLYLKPKLGEILEDAVSGGDEE